MASLRKPFESAKMLKLVRAALDEEDLSGY
jgi:hypothetical protein